MTHAHKFLLFSLLILSSSPSSFSFSSSPDTDFIRAICNAKTLYRALCYHSLLRYAPNIRLDPILLARAATNVSLAHATSLAVHISHLLLIRQYSSSDILHDCQDSLGDAVNEIKDSVEEIGRLETAAGPEVAWRVSNAQTWISAALTNEDTCLDGFDEHGGGRGGDWKLRDDVCGRVRWAKMFTSNALALVNSLVAE